MLKKAFNSLSLWRIVAIKCVGPCYNWQIVMLEMANFRRQIQFIRRSLQGTLQTLC